MKKNKFDKGGDGPEDPIKQPKGYKTLDSAQRRDWNNYLDYLESKGVAGSKDLDKGEDRAREYFKEYQKANPKTSINYDMVPFVQYEQEMLRKGNSFPTMTPEQVQVLQQRMRKTNSQYMDQSLSPIDGRVGSFTSKQRYGVYSVTGDRAKDYDVDMEGYSKDYLSAKPKFEYGGNPFMGAMSISALAAVANMLEKNNSDKSLMINNGLSDNNAPVVKSSRGDFDVNNGFFRPNQFTPVQFADGGDYFSNPITNIPALPQFDLSNIQKPDFDYVAQNPQTQVESNIQSTIADFSEPVEPTPFQESLKQRESSGNYKALPYKDGKLVSSAVGAYQFLWNTHKDWIMKLTGVGSKEEFRNNPQAQDLAFKKWDEGTLTPYAKKIKAMGVKDSLDEIKAKVHFAGAQGAIDYYTKGKETKDAFGTKTSGYKTYAEGGVYDLTKEEMDYIMKNGGEIEFLD